MSPSNTVDKFLSAVKESDKESIAKVYQGDDSILSFDGVDDSDGTVISFKDVYEDIADMLHDFDYTIEEESVEDDKATVKVTITTYALGDAYINAYGNCVGELFSLAFRNASDEELTSVFMSEFQKEVEKTEKNYTKTVDVNLTKVDGKWMLDKLNEDSDLYDMLQGGMISAGEKFKE